VLTTVIGALLPVVVTLLLGVAAAWHHDFDDKQAGVLNRMVMLYALPMLLFAGMVAIPRHQLTGDIVLAAVIVATMTLSYIVPLVLARYIFGRDLATSALQALAIAAPSFAFVGFPVLGYLFGADAATIPVAISGLVLNLFQFPLSMVLLTIGTAGKGGTDGPRESLFGHVLTAFKQPVVWSPILALIVMMLDLDIPDPVRQSLELLGKTTGGAAGLAPGNKH
jgi:malonate transporter